LDFFALFRGFEQRNIKKSRVEWGNIARIGVSKEPNDIQINSTKAKKTITNGSRGGRKAIHFYAGDHNKIINLVAIEEAKNRRKRKRRVKFDIIRSRTVKWRVKEPLSGQLIGGGINSLTQTLDGGLSKILRLTSRAWQSSDGFNCLLIVNPSSQEAISDRMPRSQPTDSIGSGIINVITRTHLGETLIKRFPDQAQRLIQD